MAEKQLQNKIKLYAKQKNMLCFKVAAQAQRGLPDLCIVSEGVVGFVEVKHPDGTGRLSALQEYTINQLKQRGIPVEIAHDFETAKAFIDALRLG